MVIFESAKETIWCITGMLTTMNTRVSGRQIYSLKHPTRAVCANDPTDALCLNDPTDGIKSGNVRVYVGCLQPHEEQQQHMSSAKFENPQILTKSCETKLYLARFIMMVMNPSLVFPESVSSLRYIEIKFEWKIWKTRFKQD